MFFFSLQKTSQNLIAALNSEMVRPFPLFFLYGERCYDYFVSSGIVRKGKEVDVDQSVHAQITFALNFSKNYEWFGKPHQILERVFDQVSKHLEVG